MKVVDARLQHVTHVEQLAIAGSKAAYDHAKPVPEALDREPRFGQGLFIYEIIKSFRNAQSVCLDGVHVTVPYLRPPAAGHLSGPNIANEVSIWRASGSDGNDERGFVSIGVRPGSGWSIA
jgi:hypothetical protein